MTTPGVGPVVAITFKTAVDDPTRIAKSKALYEAANVLLSRVTRFSALKRWGMDIAKRGELFVAACHFGPAEARAVYPHTMQDHAEFAREGDFRPLHSASFGDVHSPPL